jgi:hypothetical protein
MHGLQLLRQLDNKDREIESLKAQLAPNIRPPGMQDLLATIKAEVKREAQAGKMAIVGESMVTQTEDDGTASKFTELAVEVAVVLDKVAKRDKNNSDTIASKLEETVKLQIAGSGWWSRFPGCDAFAGVASGKRRVNYVDVEEVADLVYTFRRRGIQVREQTSLMYTTVPVFGLDPLMGSHCVEQYCWVGAADIYRALYALELAI